MEETDKLENQNINPTETPSLSVEAEDELEENDVNPWPHLREFFEFKCKNVIGLQKVCIKPAQACTGKITSL